eukprot:scaffold110685_cov27-Phaeocystis_antarctica.AAC.1
MWLFEPTGERLNIDLYAWRVARYRAKWPLGEGPVLECSRTCTGSTRGASMTSTRRGKAPLTPGARGATRNARLSRWSYRHRQPAMLLG